MQSRQFFLLLLAVYVSSQMAAHAQTLQSDDGGVTSTAALTIEQALDEAVQSNLNLLAERVNLTIAEASLITARLRPNPVMSLSADHMDWLGTGFNQSNNGGPPEISWRVDVPIERGGKRELRIETAALGKAAAEARLLESIRSLRADVALACIDVLQ